MKIANPVPAKPECADVFNHSLLSILCANLQQNLFRQRRRPFLVFFQLCVFQRLIFENTAGKCTSIEEKIGEKKNILMLLFFYCTPPCFVLATYLLLSAYPTGFFCFVFFSSQMSSFNQNCWQRDIWFLRFSVEKGLNFCRCYFFCVNFLGGLPLWVAPV